MRDALPVLASNPIADGRVVQQVQRTFTLRRRGVRNHDRHIRRRADPTNIAIYPASLAPEGDELLMERREGRPKSRRFVESVQRSPLWLPADSRWPIQVPLNL